MSSRATKILIGCGIGCGSLVLLIVVAGISFVVWLQRPGELLEPRELMLPGARAYAEWTLRLEDEGTREFAEEVVRRLAELSRRARTPVGGPAGSWLGEFQARNNERQLLSLFPMVAMWTMRPEGDDEAHLFALSIERLGGRMRFFDWLMGKTFDEAEVIRHAGERIYRPSGIGDAELAAMVAALPERPVRAAGLNDRGDLGALWLGLVGAPAGAAADASPWPRIVSGSASGGLAGRGFELRLTFVLDRPAGDEDAAWLRDSLTARLSGGGIEHDLVCATEGSEIRIDLKIVDTIGALDHAFSELPVQRGTADGS